MYIFPPLGYWIAIAYLAIGAVFDLRSKGTKIPGLYLTAGLILGVAYFACSTFISYTPFPILVFWGIVLIATSMVAMFIYRTGMLGHADMYALVALAFLSPGTALPAFLLGCAMSVVLDIALAVWINSRRHALTSPLRLIALKATPRLLGLPCLSWSRANDENGKLVLVQDLEHADLTVNVGDEVIPTVPLLPFMALAQMLLVLMALANVVIPFLMVAYW